MNVKNLSDVDPKQDFVKMEQELLKWWYDDGVVDQYLKKNEKSKKNFSFIDGPITANNPMGIHHAWGRTYKDVVQRYKNMQGFEQRFQNGFDCQGLWVEVEVEKALGFNSKKDIEEFGLGKFTDACVARVNKFAAIQTNQSKRLGMFMDWDNSYYTMSEDNNLYIWAFLKKCQEKGLLYKSKASTTWCPRCETGLSQHEQIDGYQVIKDRSVYVLFKLTDRKDEYILAWTTTPWTLSANVLLAVNPELEYVKVQWEGKTVYLAKDATKRLGFKEFEDIDVKTLLGAKYESLYDIPVQKDVDHYVVEWELVEASSGSGVVHIAPGCGQEDFELGSKLGTPTLSPLSTSGVFGEGYGDLTGKYAHDVVDMVVEYLKEKDLFFKEEQYEHSYPHCWRCKTKCLFRLEDNWMIRVSELKDQMKELSEKVSWNPEFVGKRMQNWLDNMGDWMISRKRYYGLSLPFYECTDCNKLHVVGSKDELKELAVDPTLVDKLPSLHRPWVDDIKIKCSECESELERVKDVGDCWLDAGVVPFSTLKYLEDKKYWEKWFPADFITESIEQVRLWFYSMLVFGTVFESKYPYQYVLGFAEMRDEHNEKMSKTKPNYVEFNAAADKVGTDMIRWNFATASTGANMRFGWPILEDVRRRFYLTLWNSYSYFVTYAKSNEVDLSKYDSSKVVDVMDMWVLSKVKKLSIDVEESMDRFDMATASRDIENFVNELSTWYIRRGRERFKSGDLDALGTLHYVLVVLTKLLAPFMPFVADDMYQNLVVNMKLVGAKKSVHLEEYPAFKKDDVKEEVLNNMEVLRDLAKLGLSIRDSSKLKLKQPLSTLKVSGVKLDKQYLDILAGEMNVKSVEVVEKVEKEKGWNDASSGTLSCSLCTELSEALKMEGMYRELTRQIQNARKNMGLAVGEKVKLRVGIEDENLLKFVEENKQSLMEAVSALDLQLESTVADDWEQMKVESSVIGVKLEKA